MLCTESKAMRVLLVEDDRGIISFPEKGLREVRYALDVAQDGDDALYKKSLKQIGFAAKVTLSAKPQMLPPLTSAVVVTPFSGVRQIV